MEDVCGASLLLCLQATTRYLTTSNHPVVHTMSSHTVNVRAESFSMGRKILTSLFLNRLDLPCIQFDKLHTPAHKPLHTIDMYRSRIFLQAQPRKWSTNSSHFVARSLISISRKRRPPFPSRSLALQRPL